MQSSARFDWYAKYIAESASTGETINRHYQRVSLVWTEFSGRHAVLDKDIATVALAGVTLVSSLVLPLICVRIARMLAVLWSLQHRSSMKDSTQKNTPAPHFPILLANAGLWLSDILAGIDLVVRSCRLSDWSAAWRYWVFCLLCFVGVVVGPLTSLLVSNEFISGFAGKYEGPCFPQNNFTAGALGFVSTALDHHGRAIELLPWVGSFDFPWNISAYQSSGAVVHPISKVKYEHLDG